MSNMFSLFLLLHCLILTQYSTNSYILRSLISHSLTKQPTRSDISQLYNRIQSHDDVEELEVSKETFQEYLARTTRKIQGKMITPYILRNLEFTTSDGTKRKVISQDKAVVVFLRHLG